MKTILSIVAFALLANPAVADVPKPTDAQIALATWCMADATCSSDADKKAKAELILSRAFASVTPVCTLNPEPTAAADCAIEIEDVNVSFSQRNACIGKVKALSGEEKTDAKKAIKVIVAARKMTKKHVKVHGLIGGLPENPRSIEQCLMGIFTADMRENCCAALPGRNVECGLAATIDEASRVASPVCN